MAKKKSVEQQRKEFFEREAREYAKRVKPVVIQPAKAVETTEETEETGETNENEETEETEGE